jgi:predicted NBD/HSP70 family sugar kinase
VTYDPEPRYPVIGGTVEVGYAPLAGELAGSRPRVLAVDGPAALPWERFVAELVRALEAAGVSSRALDVRASFAPWEEIERRTAAATLPGDPVFGRLFEGSLASLFAGLPVRPEPRTGLTVVFGPGAALVQHDALWYADVPKRLSLTAVHTGTAGNVGQPPGQAGSEQRLLFVDWPMLDRHKRSLAPSLDRYLDLGAADAPRSLAGSALRESLAALAAGPFRTRPSFLPGPWGGQWLRRELGIPTDAQNVAWSYELIPPEAGVLIGERPLEVAFELLLAVQGERILGTEPAARFGGTFPIRFDYLDTLEGGHLSIQCHPSEEYMRATFGWPYTQHESYYVMVTTPGAKIFLGLHDDVDLAAFRAEALRAERPGVAFEPERYLQAHAAERHRLYLIPGGTPHASGAGNVVLEISATPYLYTLRFYDWLRENLDGRLRPVHLDHAFANLDPRRRGGDVRRDLDRDRCRRGALALVRGDDRHAREREPVPDPAAPRPGLQGREGGRCLSSPRNEALSRQAKHPSEVSSLIAAFDIGGGHVSAAQIDPDPRSIVPASRCRIALRPEHSREELVARLLRAAAAVASDELRACGVAVPGPFDYEGGISRLRHKLAPLYGLDLRRELAGVLGVPSSFLNDADAFLLGEWWAGAARGHERAVGVTLGTGLGSAFLDDGRIVDSGPHVPPEGSLHLVEFRGASVEDRISQRGLLARYGDDARVDVHHVAERARRGDDRARAAFGELSFELGEFLAPWLVSFGATCLVVGGSIARAWDLIEPRLRPALASVAPLQRVAAAANLDDAPLLGAALHAAKR